MIRATAGGSAGKKQIIGFEWGAFDCGRDDTGGGCATVWGGNLIAREISRRASLARDDTVGRDDTEGDALLFGGLI